MRDFVRRPRLVGVVALACTTGFEASARADDLFEIQVFHARVNEPGQFGAELTLHVILSEVPMNVEMKRTG